MTTATTGDFAFAATTDGGGTGGALPPRPTFNASFAANFMRDFQQVQLEETHRHYRWAQFDEAYRLHQEVIDALYVAAWEREEPLSQVEMKAFASKLRASFSSVGQRAAILHGDEGQLFQGCHTLATMAIDVLAHRPSQMAMLEPHPNGVQIQVNTDTPTLGPRLTDEVARTRGFGVNLS
jgi:hypothetical protein